MLKGVTMKTLFLSDLDGTFLNSKAEISQRSAEIIDYLIKQGVLFTVATARTGATVKDIFSDVNLSLPWILMNGVLIYDPVASSNISANKIFTEDAESVISVYIKYNKTPMLYILKEDHLEIRYCSLDNVYQKEYVYSRQNLNEKRFKKCDYGSMLNGDDTLIYMVSLDKEEDLAPICNEIRTQNRVCCAFYRDNYTNCNFMECMNRTVSKGVAASQLKKLLGVDKIIAFGDNLNDIPLFSVADECYAVSNACQELKDISTGVIDTNNNDGVVKFIINHYTQE